MRIAIAIGLLVAALWGAEPNLLQQAPPKWANKINPMAGEARGQKAGAKLYERERNPGESFRAYVDRVGDGRLRTIATEVAGPAGTA